MSSTPTTPHHLSQFFTPKVLIVSAVRGFLQVLHVAGQHKVSQGKEVTVGLGKQLEIIINHINQCSVFNVRFDSTSGSVKLGPVTSVVKSMRK